MQQALTPSKNEVRRPADSSERVYQEIRKLLVEFQLRPDDRVNEVHLARSLGVSRTPIREALHRLASEGFVTLRPNRGFFVRSLSTDGILDLYELRQIIEGAAFRLMCERADDSQLHELNDFWQSVREGYGERAPDEILELDERLHMMIAERSGNPELVSQLASINARIRFIRRIQIEHPSHGKNQIDAHNGFIAAAMRRDAEAGAALLHEHIELTIAATQAAIKDALMRVFMDEPKRPRRRPRADQDRPAAAD